MQVVGKSVKPYMPDFKLAFEHFCIHPGGKAVIDAVGEQLGLSKRQCMPMLRPFERFGNTSSCSTWYVIPVYFVYLSSKRSGVSGTLTLNFHPCEQYFACLAVHLQSKLRKDD